MLFVTDVPLASRNPAGFSARCVEFVRALAAAGSVDVLLLVRPYDRLGAEDPDLGARSVRRVHSSPRVRSTSDRLLRAARRTLSPWPSFSRGVDANEAHELLRTSRAGAVVLYLPYLAHLARYVDTGTPVVFAFEEAWERVERLEPRHRTALERLNMLSDRWRVPRQYRVAAERGSLWTAISEPEAVSFRQRADGSVEVVVFPHGIDTDQFAPQDRPPTHDVLVVGDMRQSRNLRPTLRVLEEAQRSGRRSLDWAIVGPVDLDRVPRDLGKWTGYVDELPPYYWSSRVAVVPQEEGTGVKGTLLQAWACGTPVVASPHSALSAGGIDGEDLLVARSPSEMVAAVHRLITDEALADRLVVSGLERARAVDIRRTAALFAEEVRSAIRR